MGCNGCATGGCAKLNVLHDWLSDIHAPDHREQHNIYEIRFKSTRKGFFKNAHALDLAIGDLVVVEADRGYDIGVVSVGGEVARLQMKKKRIDERHVLRILRRPNESEQQRYDELRAQEQRLLVRTRAIIYTTRMDMKLSDIEFQGDGSKAIFYYTADKRVDFRELIKILAGEFRVRIEMRQIGLRQESAMVGGLGSCGRELCCSSWLTDFKSVTTTAARYQNISLNPAKITGQCGRLKCCLNYELETYLDALKDIPSVNEIHTELGVATLQKTDIFKGVMWFSYGGDANWTALDVATVVALAAQNKQGVKPPSLTAAEAQAPARPGRTRQGRPGVAQADGQPDFVDVVGQSRLHERSDRRRRPKGGGHAKAAAPHAEGGEKRPNNNNPRRPRPEGDSQQQPRKRPPRKKNPNS